jgi:hypothetical protein
VRVVVVEWDAAPADEARQRWVVREYRGVYAGEGFKVGALEGNAQWVANRLAAWLNERDGVEVDRAE